MEEIKEIILTIIKIIMLELSKTTKELIKKIIARITLILE